MSQPRIRYDARNTYYHIFNRTAGEIVRMPLDDVAREHMFDLISVVIMSNHYHIVCMAPSEKPSLDEVKRHWRAFYKKRGRAEPDWKNPEIVEKWASRMRDISHFMRDVLQRFTRWYNRVYDCRGTLWTDRFKSVVLEGGRAVYECVRYVEMNPVRAGLCPDPGQYRFSTWGRYTGSGKHPFAESATKHLRKSLIWLYGEERWGDADGKTVLQYFAGTLAAAAAYEAGASEEEAEALRKAVRRGKGNGFVVTVHRRVRYWTAGAIIGSKAFVREIAAAHWGAERAKKKRLAPARPWEMAQQKQAGGDALYSWRYLSN